jgi:hypothetical protein
MREKYPLRAEILLAIERARRYVAKTGEHRSGAGKERPGSTQRTTRVERGERNGRENPEDGSEREPVR